MNGIKYTEPKEYMPKEILDKYFGKDTKKTEKKTTPNETGTKKKTK